MQNSIKIRGYSSKELGLLVAISEKTHQKLTIQTVGVYCSQPNRQIFGSKPVGELENLDAVVFLTNRFYVAVHLFSGRYIIGYRLRQ